MPDKFSITTIAMAGALALTFSIAGAGTARAESGYCDSNSKNFSVKKCQEERSRRRGSNGGDSRYPRSVDAN